jgi:hypothetical protein
VEAPRVGDKRIFNGRNVVVSAVHPSGQISVTDENTEAEPIPTLNPEQLSDLKPVESVPQEKDHFLFSSMLTAKRSR